MENTISVNQFLDESTINQLASINDIIDHIENESFNTIGKMFGIRQKNIDSIKNYFKNIIIPKLYIHNNQILKEFLDFVNNLDIIREQITPIPIFNLNYLNSYFYCIQIKNDECQSISISPSTEYKNKTTFLQIIPNGLFLCPDFSVLQNGKPLDQSMIYHGSYIKLQNIRDRIILTFKNCPQNLFFIQILFYKKLTINSISQMLRNNLHIPNDVSDFKAKICHNNHFFKLTQLINLIQKENSMNCPICHKKIIYINYYNEEDESKEKALNCIFDDNEKDLITIISSLHDDVYSGKYKMPTMLQNKAPFLSFCAFFNSQKCFYSLIEYYKMNDQKNKINLKDQCERSIIHFACYNGDLSMIQTLIESNESLDCQDCDGLKPIHYAAIGGNIDVIKFLYENQFDVFSCDNRHFKSPLHFACQYGHLSVIQFYCEYIIPNSNVNNLSEFLTLFCPYKITPLHTACKWNQINVLNYFIDHDLVNLQNSFNINLTPLEVASRYGSFECIRILTNHKNKFIDNDFQIEKAFKKALIGGHLDILRYFLKTASIKISNYYVLEAIASDNFEIAKLLIQNIKKPNNLIKRLVRIICPNESSLLINSNDQFDNQIETNEASCNSIQQNKTNNDDINDSYFTNNDSENQLSSDCDQTDYDNFDCDSSEYYYYDYYYSDCNSSDYNSSDCDSSDYESSNSNSSGYDISDCNETSEIKEPDDISLNRISPLPIPEISISMKPTTEISSQFVPHTFKPCPFVSSQSNSTISGKQVNTMQLIQESDPSSIDYVKNHATNGPLTFTDLSKCCFMTKQHVKIAVQNISIIEQRSVHIVKSNPHKVVYKCIDSCRFSMTWQEKDRQWIVPNNGFIEHNCTLETAKKPRFHSTIIDSAIQKMKLSCTETSTGMTILNHLFGHKALKKTLKRRLQSKHISQLTNEQWWQMIPRYLMNNILNGGLSDMIVTENNEVYSFAMLPQYSKLLLSSKAILPVIILDGTFQSSIYRGSLIIVMAVSSNRTNIPLGWAWGPSENADAVKLILQLIKEVNGNIETVISDEGKALKAAVNEIFPDAVHKFCAWHISKGIKNPQIRSIFWQLLRSDHPLIFQNLMCILYKISGDTPQLLANGRIGMFSRYFEGVKENDLITSSPCESINAEISKMKTETPIKIFHHLEIIGYNRCLDLLNITSPMTPYYLKRKNHIEAKAQRLLIIEEESFETSRTIIDLEYPYPAIRWEINTRDYSCPCGKYTDRGFPCAHLVKAFQSLNQSYEHCVHECYYTSTIKEALKDIHSPVSFDIVERDTNLHSLPAHVRTCRTKRYKFGFERTNSS